MAGTTKITLSDKELSLVTNADWILTKHSIIEKVYALFAECIPVVNAVFNEKEMSLPAEVIAAVPKIYKGENYLRLPYVMLDHPRCFKGKDIFAVRTMFWWGNFFSVTLHISGVYKDMLTPNLVVNAPSATSDFYIGINEDQWQHHFEENNFLPLKQLSKANQLKLLDQNDFTKLALKFDLQQWDQMQALLQGGYRAIAGVIS
ncbi:hypothetical protein BH11BAC4_BH11BAC4_13020 [soil metagenome]